MGIQIRWALSMDEDTVRIFDRLRERYAPLMGSNRSAALRLMLRLLDQAPLEGEDFKMGLTKQNVPVRLDAKTIERIDEDVRRFAPFCEGRSAMARLLIHLAHSQIDSGEINWTISGIQRALKLTAPRPRGGDRR